MTKQEFLAGLEEKLSGLPKEDIDGRLSFYSEIIDDRMEDGIAEESVVEELGSLDEIAAQIIEEIPIGKLVKEKIRTRKPVRVWEIILLVLGFPVWGSLLIAAFAVLLSLYIVLWALIIVLWAIELSFIVCVPACVAGGILLICEGKAAEGIAAIGAGIVFAGLSIFLFFGCRAASKGAVALTKKIGKGIKSLFIKKEIEK